MFQIYLTTWLLITSTQFVISGLDSWLCRKIGYSEVTLHYILIKDLHFQVQRKSHAQWLEFINWIIEQQEVKDADFVDKIIFSDEVYCHLRGFIIEAGNALTANGMTWYSSSQFENSAPKKCFIWTVRLEISFVKRWWCGMILFLDVLLSFGNYS